MKRRFQSNAEYPLTTARGDIARNRGFVEQSEMRKAKRVKFEDTEMDGAPVHDSSREREVSRSPRRGAPKTSEYAYFRKVKDGAGHGHPRALQKENEQLKSSKMNYIIRETSGASDKLKPRMKDLNCPVSIERAGPSDHNLLHSPLGSKYDGPDQIRSKEITNKIKRRSPLLSEDVTPVGKSLFSSPFNKASEKSENQCSGKGIFSVKRLRLRQWVADASFSEVEKLHPKGFDLVSLLLCRLFPKGNEMKDSSKEDANNSGKSLTFHESNNPEKGLNLSHKREWDKDLPKICSGRSSDIVPLEWDSFVSGFPSYYGEVSNLQDESMDPDQHAKSLICRNSYTQRSFSFCLPFGSYRSSVSSQCKDLDESGSIIECERKDPRRFLLEWDFELGKDRVGSSIVNHDAEKNMCARLADPWTIDQQRTADNVLNAKMRQSSLFQNYYLEFNALPNYRSNGRLHDFGPKFDDVKSAMAEPGRFSLALPCTPKCITLAEEENAENILSNSNIIFSYSDQHWLKKKIWNGKPQSEFWWKCLSAEDFPAEDHPSVFHAWQFPENESNLYSLSRLKEAAGGPFTPFHEGAFNRYLLSPILQSSVDTFTNCPLLLNHASEDSPDQELSIDDYDNELGYRKIL